VDKSTILGLKKLFGTYRFEDKRFFKYDKTFTIEHFKKKLEKIGFTYELNKVNFYILSYRYDSVTITVILTSSLVEVSEKKSNYINTLF